MGKASTRKKPKESPGGRLAARDAARPTSAVASKLLSSSFRDPLQLSQGDNEEPFTEEENIALAPNSLDGEGEEAAPAVLVSRKVAVPVVSRGNSVKQALDLLDSPRAEGNIEDVVPSSIESFTGQRGGGYGQGEDTQPSQPQSQGSQSQTQSVKRKRGQHDLTVAPQPARRLLEFAQDSPAMDENSLPIGTFDVTKRRKAYSEAPQPEMLSQPQPEAEEEMQQQEPSPPEPHISQSPTQLSPVRRRAAEAAPRSPSPRRPSPRRPSPQRDTADFMETMGTAPMMEPPIAQFNAYWQGIQTSWNQAIAENNKLKIKVAKRDEELKTIGAKHAKELAVLKRQLEENGKKQSEEARRQEELLSKAREAIQATKVNLQKNVELADQRGKEVDELQEKIAQMQTRDVVKEHERRQLADNVATIGAKCASLQAEAEELRGEVETLKEENVRLANERAHESHELSRMRSLLSGMDKLMGAYRAGAEMASPTQETPLARGGGTIDRSQEEALMLSQDRPLEGGENPGSRDPRSSGGGQITSPTEPSKVPATVMKPRNASPRKNVVALKDAVLPRSRTTRAKKTAEAFVNDSESGEDGP